MKRNEINSQLTWGLYFLSENQGAFKAQFALAQEEIKLLQVTLSSPTDDRASFISFTEHQETLERYLDNLVSYAKMSSDAGPENMQNQENLTHSYTLYQQVNQALFNLPSLLVQNREQIEQWLLENDCRGFRYPVEEVFHTIPHQLNEGQKILFAQTGELIRNPQETFESFRP